MILYIYVYIYIIYIYISVCVSHSIESQFERKSWCQKPSSEVASPGPQGPRVTVTEPRLNLQKTIAVQIMKPQLPTTQEHLGTVG